MDLLAVNAVTVFGCQRLILVQPVLNLAAVTGAMNLALK